MVKAPRGPTQAAPPPFHSPSPPQPPPTVVPGCPPQVPPGSEKAKLKVKVSLNLNGVVAVESVQLVEEEEVEEEAAPAAEGAAAAADRAVPEAGGGGDAAQPMEQEEEEAAVGPPPPPPEPAAAAGPQKVTKRRVRKHSVAFTASTAALGEARLAALFEAECEMALQARVQVSGGSGGGGGGVRVGGGSARREQQLQRPLQCLGTAVCCWGSVRCRRGCRSVVASVGVCGSSSSAWKVRAQVGGSSRSSGCGHAMLEAAAAPPPRPQRPRCRAAAARV